MADKSDHKDNLSEKSKDAEKTGKDDRVTKVNSYLDIIAKIFGLVSWPVVVLIFLLLFFSQIKEMVSLLPEKFAKSNELSVAGFLSLKIQEEAKATGNEELASIISGLSQEAIKELITLGGTNSYRVMGSGRADANGVDQEYYLPLSKLAIWKELASRGLAKSTVDLSDFEKYIYTLNPTVEDSGSLGVDVKNLSKEQRDKLIDNHVELTESGRRAYDIIIKVISDLISSQ
jgi:hypothetical protein